jgi:hypothetical protein
MTIGNRTACFYSVSSYGPFIRWSQVQILESPPSQCIIKGRLASKRRKQLVASAPFRLATWAAWLYDVLKPHVQEIVVCNPRRNALLKEGSKSDKVDARKLAELLLRRHAATGLPRTKWIADAARVGA